VLHHSMHTFAHVICKHTNTACTIYNTHTYTHKHTHIHTQTHTGVQLSGTSGVGQKEVNNGLLATDPGGGSLGSTLYHTGGHGAGTFLGERLCMSVNVCFFLFQWN